MKSIITETFYRTSTDTNDLKHLLQMENCTFCIFSWKGHSFYFPIDPLVFFHSFSQIATDQAP